MLKVNHLRPGVLIGAYQGFAQFYRFAAAEVASSKFRSRAISFVLAGGVVAAVAGPHLGNHTGDLLGSDASFAGSYAAAVVLLSLAAMALLTRLKVPPPAAGADGWGGAPAPGDRALTRLSGGSHRCRRGLWCHDPRHDGDPARHGRPPPWGRRRRLCHPVARPRHVCAVLLHRRSSVSTT